MPVRAPNISPLQVIYQAFPGAVRFVSGQIARVRDISSSRGEREDRLSELVRRTVARRIFVELERRHAHDMLRHARRLERPRAVQAIVEGRGIDGDADAIPDAFDPFDLVIPADEEPAVPAGGGAADALRAPPAPAMPREREISVIEIDEDATVRTRVFPRSVHCQRCGHFEILNPERVPATLQCRCCREAMLRIEPIVFICGRCGEIRELVPPLELRGDFRQAGSADRAMGAPIRCPDCQRGHIHLQKHATNDVARWEWVCPACSVYRVRLQERCVRCAIPRSATEASNVIFMNAIPASAPNALQALAHQEMFVGNAPVDLAALRAAARSGRESGWADSFEIELPHSRANLSEEDAASLAEAGLVRAYLVRDVWAVTACYGYKAGQSAAHPQSPVLPEERLATLFGDPERFARFRVFTHTTRGAALVLEFNREQVVSRLAELVPSLRDQSIEQVVEAEAHEIAHRQIRELLRVGGGRLIAYRALHALEHALLMAAMRQLGSDTIGSRLFTADATVVLFEKSEVGRGGVVQLVNRGDGLVQLIRASRDLMAGCAQGCVDGCPSCVFLRDQHCGHPLDELGVAWLPANALLSRAGAARILGSNGAQ